MSDTTVIVDRVKNTVQQLFVSKGIYACCSVASILTKELLALQNVHARLVEGYWNSGQVCGRHYWLEIDNCVIDVGSDVLRTHRPDFPIINCSLTAVNPRIDNETVDEQYTVAELERSYKIYCNKGCKSYMKSAPRYIRNFARRHGVCV